MRVYYIKAASWYALFGIAPVGQKYHPDGCSKACLLHSKQSIIRLTERTETTYSRHAIALRTGSRLPVVHVYAGIHSVKGRIVHQKIEPSLDSAVFEKVLKNRCVGTASCATLHPIDLTDAKWVCSGRRASLPAVCSSPRCEYLGSRYRPILISYWLRVQ